jgi:putative endonuclease
MNHRTYWVYIMTNRSGTLYVGMTNDLIRRVSEHRRGQIPGFTARYKISRLIHAESCSNVVDAIAREKEIKAWRREKKLALIAESNPDWLDLAREWFSEPGVTV